MGRNKKDYSKHKKKIIDTINNTDLSMEEIGLKLFGIKRMQFYRVRKLLGVRSTRKAEKVINVNGRV